MIDEIRNWMMSLIACILIFSVVQAVTPEGTARKVTTFCGKTILLLYMISPIFSINYESISWEFSDITERIEEQQTQLQEESMQELNSRIAEETEEYISDKANRNGEKIRAIVETDSLENGVMVPYAVTLYGDYSPETAAWIDSDLGISPERQVWIQ